MENDSFLINVNISGLKLPLRIAREDEELYRRAEKLLVKKLEHFRRIYHQRKNEDILTLVAFDLAIAASMQEFAEDIVPLAEKIKTLDEELKELLSKE